MEAPGVPYKFGTSTLREIKQPSDFPSGTSYVIQFYEDSSIYHEGDERSRTHPGHGYPAYTEHVLKVRQFVTRSREEWQNTVEALYQIDRNRTDIAVFQMQRADVTTKVAVTVAASSI